MLLLKQLRFKHMCSREAQTYCTFIHAQTHGLGKKGSQDERSGGESDIMRDNETEGGVDPENTKWA